MKKLFVLILVVVTLLTLAASALAIDPPGTKPTIPTSIGTEEL